MNQYQIGARDCLFITEDKSNYIVEMFIFLYEFIIATFLFTFVLPIITMFLFYRMGFKNTIRFFKRCDREYKRKKQKELK